MSESAFSPSVRPQIAGDPILALVAQLNRFRKSASQPEHLLMPLQPVTREIATEAILTLQSRAVAAAIEDPLAGEMVRELSMALGNPVAYVAPRVSSLAQTLALFGDSIGLAPAAIGITTVDPRFHPKWDIWMYLSVFGALSIGALAAGVLARRLSRRAAAA